MASTGSVQVGRRASPCCPLPSSEPGPYSLTSPFPPLLRVILVAAVVGVVLHLLAMWLGLRLGQEAGLQHRRGYRHNLLLLLQLLAVPVPLMPPLSLHLQFTSK